MKIWSTATADRRFSIYIRGRDPICVYCRRQQATDCSHFFERGNSGTRFDPINCDGLCRKCHDFFHRHRAAYIEFKLRKIGRLEMLALSLRATRVMPREEAIIRVMKLLA